MNLIVLGMDIIVFFSLLFILTIPLILFIAGMFNRKTNPKTAKILFIIAAVYLLVSSGICGSLLMQ